MSSYLSLLNIVFIFPFYITFCFLTIDGFFTILFLLNYSFTFYSLKPKSFPKLQNSFWCGHTTRGLTYSISLCPPGVLHSPNWIACLWAYCSASTGGLPFILSWEFLHLSVLESRTSLFLACTLLAERSFENVHVKKDVFILHSQLIVWWNRVLG